MANILRLGRLEGETYLTGQPLLDWLDEFHYPAPVVDVPVYDPPEQPTLSYLNEEGLFDRGLYLLYKAAWNEYGAERRAYDLHWKEFTEPNYLADVENAGILIGIDFDILRRVEYEEKNRRVFKWEFFPEDQTVNNSRNAAKRVIAKTKTYYVRGVGVVYAPVNPYQEIAFGSTNGLQRV